MFVLATLQSSGPKLSPCAIAMLQHCHRTTFKQYQRLLLLRQRQGPNQPVELLVAIPRAPFRPAGPLGNQPHMPLVHLLAHGDDMPAPLGKEANGPAPLGQQEQLREFIRQQIDGLRFQMAVAKELEKDDRATLRKKLRDPNPTIRWLAIQSISQRRLPCEEELIQRLKDPVAGVRDSAHQALLRLARGTDLGPFRAEGGSPVAVRRAQDEAVASWREWVRSQRDLFGGSGQE